MKSTIKMMTTLLKSVPVWATTVFVSAVVLMNFLARYSLFSRPWLALNAGITVSWLSFLILDVFVKTFGVKAANILSLLAVITNLLYTFLCLIISVLAHSPGLDMVFGGQWSILTASTVAYIFSALTNNYTNIFIGKRIKADPDSKSAFALRSFISTFLSQVIDNFLFVFLAFWVMPFIPGAFPVRWSIVQCISCSVLCAIIEMLSEIVFSPLGYHTAKKWKEKGVGKEYTEKYCPDGVL